MFVCSVSMDEACTADMVLALAIDVFNFVQLVWHVNKTLCMHKRHSKRLIMMALN